MLKRQFLCFTLVGGVGTAAHYAVLISMVSGMGINPVISTTAGFMAGMVINYLLNRRYTFFSRRAHREAFWRFVTVAFVGMLINSTAMAVFNLGLNIHYLAAQVMATALVLSWNFLGSRYWVFNDARE